ALIAEVRRLRAERDDLASLKREQTRLFLAVEQSEIDDRKRLEDEVRMHRARLELYPELVQRLESASAMIADRRGDVRVGASAEPEGAWLDRLDAEIRGLEDPNADH